MKPTIWLLIKMLKRRKLALIALDFIRHDINRRILKSVRPLVLFGPFKDLEIVEPSAWDAASATASKILGLYEQEVLLEIQKLGRFKTLINIGAADGYYGFGMLKAKLCEEVIFFESNSESRQQIINRNISLENTNQIYPEATEVSLNSVLSKINLKDTLFIVDIEGGEYNLFSETLLNIIKTSTIILEIHEFLEPQFEKVEFERRFLKNFEVKKIFGSSRVLPKLDILDKLSDNEKWLFVSEGRIQSMEWWIMTPKEIESKYDN